MSKNKTCGACKHYIAEMYHCQKNDVMAESFNTCEDFEPRTITNGDVIRQMNTSGLIDVISCPYPNKDCIHRLMHGYACKCCKRDWLNAPTEGEVNNEQ